MTDQAARALGLLRRLVSCRSITPDPAGALDIAQDCLGEAGFACERISHAGVENLWATHGSGEPGIVLCGHVDVVPPGDLEDWSHDPFVPTELDGKLYGRGATDMKGGVASMLVAATDYVISSPDHGGTIAVALTSDEEGQAIGGIRHVVEQLRERGLGFRHGLVGEPSSSERFGDTLRVGRRGSLTGTVTFFGKQGHVAYPDRHQDSVPALAQVISAIAARQFDPPADGVEPTLVRVTKVVADAGASNVVPAKAIMAVNMRHVEQDDPAMLRDWVEGLCAGTGLRYKCEWEGSSRPYYTGADSAIGQIVTEAASEVNGFAPSPSVGGGTSDGRFLVDLCDEVVEFGSIGRTMHQVDEHIVISELGPLVEIYRRVLERVLQAG